MLDILSFVVVEQLIDLLMLLMWKVFIFIYLNCFIKFCRQSLLYLGI